MGTLTDAMFRLRGEIDTLRDEREAGTRQLEDDVAEMLNNFHSAHAEMAQNSKAARQAFIFEMQNDARTSLAARQAFISQQKDFVSHLRQEVATDLAGAHQAFFGHVTSPSPGGSMKHPTKRKKPF